MGPTYLRATSYNITIGQFISTIILIRYYLLSCISTIVYTTIGRVCAAVSSATMSTTTTTTTVPPAAVTLQADDHPKQAREPLSLSGALDRFEHVESTPVIGREYANVNVVNDIFNAEDSDALIRDLAITSMSLTESTMTRTLTYRSLPAWRCILPSTRQPHRRPSESARPASRRTQWQTSRVNTAHPPITQQLARVRHQRPRDQHNLVQSLQNLRQWCKGSRRPQGRCCFVAQRYPIRAVPSRLHESASHTASFIRWRHPVGVRL